MFTIDSMVPITLFNKGQATKIFDRVKSDGQLVVLKNNAPSAVILSPAEYTRLTEIEENYYLLTLADERIQNHGDKGSFTEADVMKRFGITQADIDAADDVEIG